MVSPTYYSDEPLFGGVCEWDVPGTYTVSKVDHQLELLAQTSQVQKRICKLIYMNKIEHNVTCVQLGPVFHCGMG